MVVKTACRGRPKTFNNFEAIEKAQNLFWEKGYKATSLTELIEVMGISRQSMYNTFGNKHALFLQCLEYYIHEHYKKMKTDLEAPIHAEDKLKNMFAMMEGFFTCPDSKGCFTSFAIQEMAQQDSEVKRMLEDKYAKNSEVFENFFTKAIDNNEIKSFLTGKELADLYDAILLGVSSLCKLPNRQDHIRNIFKIFLKQLEFIR